MRVWKFTSKQIEPKAMKKTYLTKSIVEFFGRIVPVSKEDRPMFSKQRLMELFKCHPVLQKQD